MAYSNFENRNKRSERKSYNGFNKKPFNKTFEKKPTNVTKSFGLAFSDLCAFCPTAIHHAISPL